MTLFFVSTWPCRIERRVLFWTWPKGSVSLGECAQLQSEWIRIRLVQLRSYWTPKFGRSSSQSRAMCLNVVPEELTATCAKGCRWEQLLKHQRPRKNYTVSICVYSFSHKTCSNHIPPSLLTRCRLDVHSDMVRIDLRATLGVEMVQWETATIPETLLTGQSSTSGPSIVNHLSHLSNRSKTSLTACLKTQIRTGSQVLALLEKPAWEPAGIQSGNQV